MMPSPLDNLPRLAPIDPATAEAGAPAQPSTATESFHDYLRSAQAQKTAPASRAPGGNGSSTIATSGGGGAVQAKQRDSAGTTPQDAAQGAATPASESAADHSGQSASGTSQGQGGGDSGNSGDPSQAPAGNMTVPQANDQPSPSDGTAAAAVVAGTAAAVTVAQPPETPQPAATDAKVLPTQTASVPNRVPSSKPSSQAGAAVPTPSRQAVAGKLSPAVPATTTTGSLPAVPTTATTGSSPAGNDTSTNSAVPVTAGQGFVASPSGPVAAARRTVAASPADVVAQPAQAPAADLGPPAAAGASWQPARPGDAAPVSPGPVGQAEAASSSGTAADIPAAAAATAVAAAVSSLATASPSEKGNGVAGKEAAKPVAAGAAAGSVSTPASSVSAPAHLSAGQGAQAAGPATAAGPGDIGQADRVRFVQRVEQAFQSMSAAGGTVRLKLSPPELGSMRLEITVRNGALTARAETETSAARNVLLDNLPALRERLAQHDIKVQQFDVDVRDQSAGGTPGQASYSSDSNNRAPNHRTGRAVAADAGGAATVAVADPGAVRRGGAGSQLNVVI